MAPHGRDRYLSQSSRTDRRAMPDDDSRRRLLRTRIFLVVFFGIAILLSITTILGTWEGQREGVVDPFARNAPASAPAK
jgi:hypothetical protein